jgi:hypothetical protein
LLLFILKISFVVIALFKIRFLSQKSSCTSVTLVAELKAIVIVGSLVAVQVLIISSSKVSVIL